MSFRRYAVLYLAAALGAIYLLVNAFGLLPGTQASKPASQTSGAVLGPHPLAEGDMKKLVFYTAPHVASRSGFEDLDGKEHSLADYKGKYVLLNLWATWCPSCRKEMPSISRLKQALEGEDFAVVTVATGRNTLAGINKFFDNAGISNLPILLDPSRSMAQDMGVLGLPVTVIIDPQGQEIARLTGDAEWDSPSAQAILKELIAQQ
ncbi:MAG: thioredoxin [Rhodobacterales bacterium]|nr:MAG: thioredoxin [Rhodobacterales bacterium]